MKMPIADGAVVLLRIGAIEEEEEEGDGRLQNSHSLMPVKQNARARRPPGLRHQLEAELKGG